MKRRLFNGDFYLSGNVIVKDGKKLFKIPKWLVGHRLHNLLLSLSHIGHFDGWIYDLPLLEAIKTGNLRSWLFGTEKMAKSKP